MRRLIPKLLISALFALFVLLLIIKPVLHLPSISVKINPKQMVSLHNLLKTPENIKEIDLQFWSKGRIDIIADKIHIAGINSDDKKTAVFIGLVSNITLPRYIRWLPKLTFKIFSLAGKVALPFEFTMRFLLP